MPIGPKPQDLRDAISDALYETKSFDLPRRCRDLGLPDGTEQEAHSSKRGYVRKRLMGMDMTTLLAVADKILEDQNSPDLETVVAQVGMRGVQGEMRNLIFASLDKPEIVLRDGTRNVIEITRNADKCLLYDQPLTATGLTFQQLVDWWLPIHAPEQSWMDAAHQLYRRLYESLHGEPEQLLMRTYSERFKNEFDLPALLPQVWLHYDPFRRGAGAERPFAVQRQRMDFLMLLPGRRAAVLEIDGQHHYATDGRPDPRAYAAMVSQDRRLRLAGYEVYRFGGAEFTDEHQARVMLRKFFDELLEVSTTTSL